MPLSLTQHKCLLNTLLLSPFNASNSQLTIATEQPNNCLLRLGQGAGGFLRSPPPNPTPCSRAPSRASAPRPPTCPGALALLRSFSPFSSFLLKEPRVGHDPTPPRPPSLSPRHLQRSRLRAAAAAACDPRGYDRRQLSRTSACSAHASAPGAHLFRARRERGARRGLGASRGRGCERASAAAVCGAEVVGAHGADWAPDGGGAARAPRRPPSTDRKWAGRAPTRVSEGGRRPREGSWGRVRKVGACPGQGAAVDLAVPGIPTAVGLEKRSLWPLTKGRRSRPSARLPRKGPRMGPGWLARAPGCGGRFAGKRGWKQV